MLSSKKISVGKTLTNLQTMPESEEPPGTMANSRQGGFLWRALTVAVLSLVTYRFPQAVIGTTVDDSWNAALIYAHVKNLQFGKDIVFTYGPLGYININHFLPETAVPRLLLGMLIGTATVTGLCLLMWQMKWLWRIIWLFFFLVLSAILHWAGDDLFMELGLFAWGMLCLLHNGRKLRMCLACLGLLVAVGGLLKFTLAVVGGLTLGMVAIELLLRKKPWTALATVAGTAGGWLIGWVLLGQSPANIPNFIGGWLAMTGGYDKAMALPGWDLSLGLTMVLTTIIAGAFRLWSLRMPETGNAQWRRGLIFAWLVALVFLAWKYGYVRSDDPHLALFAALVPMICLTLEALPTANGKGIFWSRFAGAASALMAIVMLFHFSPGFGGLFAGSFGSSYDNLKNNLDIVLQPDAYTGQKVAQMKEQLDKMQLSEARNIIGDSKVDVFGEYPAYAIFNGFNYQPRPVFQSYAAYSRAPMELNERFYQSNAPEYVLFNLAPIDSRFPPLEDSLALRTILTTYDYAGDSDFFLILHRARQVAPKTNLLAEGDARLNERIDVSKFGTTNLWMEMELKPSLAGRLRQFLYQPAATWLAVWSDTSQIKPVEYRAPAPMLSAGFWANPLFLSNDDVKRWYTGQSLHRAVAYAVECDRPGAWQSIVHYRIFGTEDPRAPRNRIE